MSTPLLTFIFAGALLFLWQRDTDRHENLALGLGWALMGVGFTISLLSPDHWGRTIVAITHVPYSFSAILISWGMLHRIGVQSPVRANIAIAATGMLTMALTQTFGDSVVADLYITNLTCGAMMVMAAQLFAKAARRDLVERFILTMLILTAAQFFIRPVLSMMFDGPIAAEAYRQTVYYLAFNWVFAFGSVLFGLAQIAGAVKDRINALHDEAARDSLSGLLVRSEFEARVDRAMAQATLEDTRIALVVVDLDHFKTVNDIWGHQVGDTAITNFGQLAARMIRTSDLAGRIGGEEFCILVWNADESAAAGLAERLRQKTGELEVTSGRLDLRLSASFGVAERRDGENYRSLFARADKALYEAKQNGRDRVERASRMAAMPSDDTRQSSNQRAA